MKLHKGDTILVTAGKDRGKQGKIEKVWPKEDVVLVPNINTYKKHRKSQGEGKPGEILVISRPMNAAKVAIVCPKCKLQTRVGYRTDGALKIRVCRKCKGDIDG